MQKRAFFIIIFLIFLVPVIKSEKPEIKIDPEVEEQLKDNDQTPVIILLKEDKINIAAKEISTLNSNEFEKKNEYKTVNGLSGKINKEGLEKLRKDSSIKSVYYDNILHTTLSDTIPLINASIVHTLIGNTNLTGQGETVCVIDTGVNKSHSDLENKVIGEFCFCSVTDYGSGGCCLNNQSKDESALDDQGHGTHVAGIIAANNSLIGTAPNANIVSIKTCNNDANAACQTSDILSGIDWCVSNKTIFNISIISISLGGNSSSSECDTTFRPYVATAIANNITVVAAAGNSGSSTSITEPACEPNVTSVGASNKDYTIASYSNRNSLTTIIAPGTSIASLDYQGTTTIKSGTSMATPHVSGIIALLQQYKKEVEKIELTPLEIKLALNNTGIKVDDTIGSGLIFPGLDALSSLISIDTLAPSIIGELQNPSIVYQDTNVTLTVNVTDTNLNEVKLESNFNGSIENYTLMSSTDEYSYFIDSNNFSIGNNVTWKFYVIDKNNNTNYTSENSFEILPIFSITLNNPLNNTYINNPNIDFNFTPLHNATETILNCSLYINNELNQTNETTLTNNETIFPLVLPEQNNILWQINCSDSTQQEAVSEIRTLNIDLTNPQVSLLTPINNSFTNTNNFTFTLSDLNPDNCSLYGAWNNGWHLNTTINATNGLNSIIAEVEDGTFDYNIECTDLASNSAFNDTNYTTFIDRTNPIIEIATPLAITYDYNESLDLNFSVSDANLDTVWYNFDSANNQTITENITFNISEGNHLLFLYTNDSANNENVKTVNFSADLTYPVISLNSPSNDKVETSTNDITFSYTVSDLGISSCSLLINNNVDQTSSSISTDVAQTFTKNDMGNAGYNWSISCIDNAAHQSNSTTYTLTINYNPSSDSSSNPSSGGTPTTGSSVSNIEEDKEQETITLFADVPQEVELSQGEKVSINILGEDHSIEIDEIKDDEVTLTIRSDPITLTIKKGETKEVDINQDNKNDLSIYLKDIVNNKAQLSISKIIEKANVEENKTIESEEVKETLKKTNRSLKWIIIISSTGVMITLSILIMFITKRRKRKIEFE